VNVCVSGPTTTFAICFRTLDGIVLFILKCSVYFPVWKEI